MRPVFAFGDKKYSTVDDFDSAMLMPYPKFVELTTDGGPFDVTRAVFADADGTADVTDAYGAILEGFPLVKGENRIMISAIANVAGATKVFGAY